MLTGFGVNGVFFCVLRTTGLATWTASGGVLTTAGEDVGSESARGRHAQSGRRLFGAPPRTVRGQSWRGSAAVSETGAEAGVEAERGLPGRHVDVEHFARGRGTLGARGLGWSR